ncbi:Zinc-binding alcohol dehydrogenase domain-containing protein cipB 2 [Colletotrichum truncatum]|uniref:Zinc-binding alcohol dehydrogenase domain-containing protein cipB 2 n=1 Tax=Colletotrichum truncatum TaxID=5467 RepID=A0ACC3Z6A2_COLTU|nr:Zinc-binding alcohol dehydrogenase domain-containing protein cipB 2 [Colletotrichum truncatum]KAF6787123.1 Zinc-binding alcohol dehydrogenase domain-containing protein cipB 2 [Colletotrichum truncatum]
MTNNEAAWIKHDKAYPLEVGPAPFPEAGPGEVVLKNQVIALNPVEWNIQANNFFIKDFPFILGADAAGYVEEVGEGVTHVQKGQRVMGYCMGLGVNKPSYGAFQRYPTLFASLVSPIPDSITLEQAAVLPLAITTAATSMYHQDHLALPLPQLGVPRTHETAKTILIWGGASSVGSVAIQLAVASGLDIITTASKHNHEFVQSLGAAQVFDYKSATVVDEIVAALSGKNLVGVYDCISEPESMEPLGAILDRTGPSKVCFIVPPKINLSKNIQWTMSLAFEIMNDKGKPVLDHVWGKFVPKAIVNKQLRPKPDPVVVGNGLEDIQAGMDKQKAGVSAKKLVIRL